MKQHDLYFKVYANCIPVKGARRSTICDLQRSRMLYIPNDLYDILTEHHDKTLRQIKALYPSSLHEMLDSYFRFMTDNDLGFWTNEPERFPDLDLQWDAPAQITNAIIDSRANTKHNFKDIFDQLEGLGCRDVQLRFFDPISAQDLEALLALLKGRTIKAVDFILPYIPTFTKQYLEDLTEQYFRIKTLTIHSAPFNEVYRMFGREARNGMGNVLFVQQRIDSSAHCGAISPMYFTYNNVRAFTEAVNHNSCLNRKIGIDEEGYIRNCPSMPEHYGHMDTTTLKEAYSQTPFQEVWAITKDQIEVCKDCEFRYVCTDCRAYTENADDSFAKPAKCHYDPYSAKWNKPEKIDAQVLEMQD